MGWKRHDPRSGQAACRTGWKDGLKDGLAGKDQQGEEGYLQPMIHQSFLELPHKAHSKVQGPTQTKLQPPAAPLGSAQPSSSAWGA